MSKQEVAPRLGRRLGLKSVLSFSADSDETGDRILGRRFWNPNEEGVAGQSEGQVISLLARRTLGGAESYDA